MKKTSGAYVFEDKDGCTRPERLSEESSEFKFLRENLQKSLLNEEVISKELLREIGMMRSRFAGTVNMLKDDIFQLIEEKNVLQEKQIKDDRECLMSLMVSEIEHLKKQNQEIMADQQAMIREQHWIIKKLKAQLDVEKSGKTSRIDPDVPTLKQESSEISQDKQLPPIAFEDKRIILRPRVKSPKQRSIFHRAGHKVLKRFNELASFCREFIDYTFELYTLMVVRNEPA